MIGAILARLFDESGHPLEVGLRGLVVDGGVEGTHRPQMKAIRSDMFSSMHEWRI